MVLRNGISRRTFIGTAAATFVLPGVVRADDKRLKVAVLLPDSGFFAQSGQSCRRGAMASAEVLAGLGYSVELVHIDTESNPDTARTQAERAINEGAKCIVGAFDSAATLAIAQVCEQRQVPLIVNIGAAPQLTEQGYKYLVRNFPTGGMLVENGLAQIKSLLETTKLAPKTAVFLHANDNFGMAQRKGMDAVFPRAGLPFTLLESISYDPKAQDLSVEVTKIRGLNPDLLLVVTRAADAIKLIRDTVRQKFLPMGIISPGAPGLYDEEFYKALGPLADYHIDVIPWANPKSLVSQALEAQFTKLYPKHRFAVECFNAGFTFDALLTAGDAFKRAGSTNGPDLMKALKATSLADHAIIGPPIKFDDKGQNVDVPSASIQNRAQTPTVVSPAEVATMTPVLPQPPWNNRT